MTMTTAHDGPATTQQVGHDATADPSIVGPLVLAPLPSSSPSITADEFKTAFRGHPGGVALVTATGPSGPVAFTATSVASVSADPPLLVFSIAGEASAAPTITTADTVVVHLLDADHLDLARLGATSGIDRFADRGRWHALPTGEPAFDGPVWLRSVVVGRIAAGAATVIVAAPVETHLVGDRDTAEEGALVYHHRRWHRLGRGSRIDDHAI